MQKPDNDATESDTAVTTFVAGDVTISSNAGYIYTGADWSIIGSDEYTTNTQTDSIDSRLSAIEERLAILRPDEDLLDKYPALREAYDHFKLVEAIVNDKQTNIK